MMPIILYLFLFFNASILCVQSSKTDTQLIEHLLSKCDRLSRPVSSPSEVLSVQVSLQLLQIIRVDEKSQVLTTNVWQIIKWKDINLSWNPSDYENVSVVRIPINKIWRPDILLYNTADTLLTSAMTSADNINTYITSVSRILFHQLCHLCH
jgi:nicotinic acetylcholine receptor